MSPSKASGSGTVAGLALATSGAAGRSGASIVLTTVRTAAVRRGSLAHPTKFFQTSPAIKYMDFYATQI